MSKRDYTFPTAWVSPELARVMPKPRRLPRLVVRGRDGRVLQAEAGELTADEVQALQRHL